MSEEAKLCPFCYPRAGEFDQDLCHPHKVMVDDLKYKYLTIDAAKQVLAEAGMVAVPVDALSLLEDSVADMHYRRGLQAGYNCKDGVELQKLISARKNTAPDYRKAKVMIAAAQEGGE